MILSRLVGNEIDSEGKTVDERSRAFDVRKGSGRFLCARFGKLER